MSELYELPNGWEWKKLNEVFIVKDGTHDSPKYISENGYPLFTSKNLKENGLDKQNYKLISEDDYNKINQRSKVDKGDLLFAMIGTIGNPTIIDYKPNFAIKNVALFKPMDENNLIELLKYYFLSNTVIDKMLSEAKGATQKFVGLTYLRNFPFPSIPLSEQQRIVSKLDKLFEKIDKSIALHQKNMDEADAFMGSVLNDVFGELEEKYGKTALKDIAILTMGQSPKSETYNTNGLGMPFFQGKKEFGKLHPIVEKYCTEPKKVAKYGDILMSVRAPVGPTNIADVDCAIGRGLCSIRAKENQFTMYIYYFLNHFEKDIEKMGKGSTFSAINKKETETLKIPYTSLAVQKKVVKYLDEISEKIERIKSVQKEKMDSLHALKASILDRTFRGEL